MPTESNTSSEIGPNGYTHGSKRKAEAPIVVRARSEIRHMAPTETPRERMARVVKTVNAKKRSR